MPDDSEMGDKSWTEYRRLILGELERMNSGISSLHAKIDGTILNRLSKVEISVAMLQVKSGVWGAAAGFLVVVSAILLKSVR